MRPHLEVGVLGLGIIAETHLAVLAERPDVAVSFVVDPDPNASVTFRERIPPRYSSLTDALHAHDPDVVVVASPTRTHADLVCGVLTESAARVLVEKPLTHDLEALTQIRSLEPAVDLRSRLFVAHHFAFAPGVRWAVEQMAENRGWGPPTRVTSAFHDPYVIRSEQAFASYESSWLDSGANQLSMLARFVDLVELQSVHQSDGGGTSWSIVGFRAEDITGTARLFTTWRTGASSKRTTLEFGQSGVEVWLDHTAMTGFAVDGAGQLLVAHVNDGLTSRKMAHYRPLYRSLLSDTPDPILGIQTAATVIELLNGTPTP